jgi:hypothetical protein
MNKCRADKTQPLAWRDGFSSNRDRALAGTKQAYTYPAEEEPLSLPFVLILSAAGPLFSKSGAIKQHDLIPTTLTN